MLSLNELKVQKSWCFGTLWNSSTLFTKETKNVKERQVKINCIIHCTLTSFYSSVLKSCGGFLLFWFLGFFYSWHTVLLTVGMLRINKNVQLFNHT